MTDSIGVLAQLRPPGHEPDCETSPVVRDVAAFAAGNISRDEFHRRCRRRAIVVRAAAPARRQRPRTARRAAARSAAKTGATSGDGDPEEPPGAGRVTGIQRIGIATVDPDGFDVVVMIEADPAITPMSDLITLARLAAGHTPTVAHDIDPAQKWDVVHPGAGAGGAA